MGTAHHLHVVHPRGVLPCPPGPLALPLLPILPMEPPQTKGLTTLVPPPVAAQEQPSQERDMGSARCRERGCIFPALGGVHGKCFHHYREEREPTMFLSKQPTRATLDHGKFFHADEELVFGSREADRRRLEAERQAFFES